MKASTTPPHGALAAAGGPGLPISEPRRYHTPSEILPLNRSGDPGLKAYRAASKLVARLALLVGDPAWKSVRIVVAKKIKNRIGRKMVRNEVIVIGSEKDVRTVLDLDTEFQFTGKVRVNVSLPTVTYLALTELVVESHLRLA